MISDALDAYLVATDDEREPDGFWRMTPCIEASGAPDRDGYKHRGVGKKKLPAHRMAWISAHGRIPRGKVVCHACDNPACVNLFHLWLGTPAENLADCYAKGRGALGDRHPSKTRPESRPRGEGHWKSKLTEDDVRAIRAAHSGGMATRALARQYGLHQKSMIAVVRGKSWSHVK